MATGITSMAEIRSMSLWEYGAIVSEWSRRQETEVPPPSAEEYLADREELIARNDPSIRLEP